MKLAALPDIVLDALKRKVISLDVASAFTLSEDNAKISEILRMAVEREMNAQSVKLMLLGRAVRETDRRVRFVGLSAYVAAGGRVEADLFSQESYLYDEEILDELFEQRLTAGNRPV